MIRNPAVAIRVSDFGFRISFGLRISDFGFHGVLQLPGTR
jgi:hypothetical protein